MDELRKRFEELGNIRWAIPLCTFDESIDEYRSQRLPDYSLGFINGSWFEFKSKQAEVDQLSTEKAEMTKALLNQDQLLIEKDKRMENLKDFIEMALNSLNHLKENAVTHRDYGHECNWVRSFNDLIKLASDAEDSLNEALRGERE